MNCDLLTTYQEIISLKQNLKDVETFQVAKIVTPKRKYLDGAKYV